MTNASEEEWGAALLPCPFCGGDAEMENSARTAINWALCEDCGAEGPPSRNYGDAFSAWNRRAAWKPEQAPAADEARDECQCDICGGLLDDAACTKCLYSPANAMKALSIAMQSDSAYAWAWHCNVAMAAQDAGAPHGRANARAAEFMFRAFGVDTSKNDEYMQTVARAPQADSGWRPIYELEPMRCVALLNANRWKSDDVYGKHKDIGYLHRDGYICAIGETRAQSKESFTHFAVIPSDPPTGEAP